MKKFSFLSSVSFMLLLAVLLLPKQGNAATLLNGGLPMDAGFSGNLDYSTGLTTTVEGIDLYSDVQGALKPLTQITFTYVNYVPSAETFNPTDWYADTGSFSGTFSMTKWEPYDPTISNLFTAALTLINASSQDVNFSAQLFGTRLDDFAGYGLDSLSTYQTAAVSNVPLPAALPLFGLGLAGLAAAKRIRSKKSVA